MDLQPNPNPQGERIQLRREVARLNTELKQQRDEISALKTEATSYQIKLEQLQNEVKTMEHQALQETLAVEIGKQVRLHYLEQHRQRMGKGLGPIGRDRIRCGDRAAHRGRPVVDALLCLTGEMRDLNVYEDLYGVTPKQMQHLKDVPEVVEIASFHASLQSEGRMTKEFKAVFNRFCTVARSYASPMKLREAFSERSKDRTLLQIQAELQDRYDKVVAANPRGQQRSSS